MNNRGLQFRRKYSDAGDDQLIRIDCHFDELSADAWQSDKYADLTLSFQDVDGRFPGYETRGGLYWPEKLAVQPFGAGEHLTRLRPHPIAGRVMIHGSRLAIGCRIE